MSASVDDTLPEWKRLATEFGRLHGQSPQIRLHAEHCGEFLDTRKAELSHSTPTIRLTEGKDGWLWWLDGGNKSADEFVKLADAAGNLKSQIKTVIKGPVGKLTLVAPGLKELSPAAEWFRNLFDEARIAGDTKPTPRGDCLSDVVESSRLVCAEMADGDPAFRRVRDPGNRRFERLSDHTPALQLGILGDGLNDRFPKVPPDTTAIRPTVPFAAIADELWQCWESFLYGAQARISKLDSAKQTAWLKNTYQPELCGCLKRVYAALPYDADLVDCSPVHLKALRDLTKLVNQLWRKQSPILTQADEARFGEMVATFDRIRSQITPPAPIAGDGAAEANSEPPKPVNAQADVLPGGDDIGSGTGGKTPGKAGAASNPNESSGDKPKLQRCQRLAYYASRYAEWKLERQLTAQEVYEYWKEHGFDSANKETDNAAELAEYKLPDTFATFETQLSIGRGFFNDRRNESRKGRKGRSIVGKDEL